MKSGSPGIYSLFLIMIFMTGVQCVSGYTSCLNLNTDDCCELGYMWIGQDDGQALQFFKDALTLDPSNSRALAGKNQLLGISSGTPTPTLTPTPEESPTVSPTPTPTQVIEPGTEAYTTMVIDGKTYTMRIPPGTERKGSLDECYASTESLCPSLGYWDDSTTTYSSPTAISTPEPIPDEIPSEVPAMDRTEKEDTPLVAEETREISSPTPIPTPRIVMGGSSDGVYMCPYYDADGYQECQNLQSLCYNCYISPMEVTQSEYNSYEVNDISEIKLKTPDPGQESQRSDVPVPGGTTDTDNSGKDTADITDTPVDDTVNSQTPPDASVPSYTTVSEYPDGSRIISDGISSCVVGPGNSGLDNCLYGFAHERMEYDSDSGTYTVYSVDDYGNRVDNFGERIDDSTRGDTGDSQSDKNGDSAVDETDDSDSDKNGDSAVDETDDSDSDKNGDSVVDETDDSDSDKNGDSAVDETDDSDSDESDDTPTPIELSVPPYTTVGDYPDGSRIISDGMSSCAVGPGNTGLDECLANFAHDRMVYDSDTGTYDVYTIDDYGNRVGSNGYTIDRFGYRIADPSDDNTEDSHGDTSDNTPVYDTEDSHGDDRGNSPGDEQDTANQDETDSSHNNQETKSPNTGGETSGIPDAGRTDVTQPGYANPDETDSSHLNQETKSPNTGGETSGTSDAGRTDVTQPGYTNPDETDSSHLNQETKSTNTGEETSGIPDAGRSDSTQPGYSQTDRSDSSSPHPEEGTGSPGTIPVPGSSDTSSETSDFGLTPQEMNAIKQIVVSPDGDLSVAQQGEIRDIIAERIENEGNVQEKSEKSGNNLEKYNEESLELGKEYISLGGEAYLEGKSMPIKGVDVALKDLFGSTMSVVDAATFDANNYHSVLLTADGKLLVDGMSVASTILKYGMWQKDTEVKAVRTVLENSGTSMSLADTVLNSIDHAIDGFGMWITDMQRQHAINSQYNTLEGQMSGIPAKYIPEENRMTMDNYHELGFIFAQNEKISRYQANTIPRGGMKEVQTLSFDSHTRIPQNSSVFNLSKSVYLDNIRDNNANISTVEKMLTGDINTTQRTNLTNGLLLLYVDKSMNEAQLSSLDGYESFLKSGSANYAGDLVTAGTLIQTSLDKNTKAISSITAARDNLTKIGPDGGFFSPKDYNTVLSGVDEYKRYYQDSDILYTSMKWYYEAMKALVLENETAYQQDYTKFRNGIVMLNSSPVFGDFSRYLITKSESVAKEKQNTTPAAGAA